MNDNHNGNHLPDDDNPTLADAASEHAKSWLTRIFRQAIWLVPFLAVINFAQSLIKLGVGSEGWQQTVDAASRKVLQFELEPWTGIATSSVMMGYWFVRDGWKRLFRRPTMAILKEWWNRTTGEWLNEERAKERAKGRTEGEATGFIKGEAAGFAKGEASGDAKGYARAQAEMSRNIDPNNGSPPNGDPPQSGNQAS